MGSAAYPSQRQLDDVLKDIIRAARRHPGIGGVRELTAWLKHDFPDEYGHRQPDTLRKDVSKAMHWAASRVYRLKLLADDLKRGVSFDEAVATAQARPLRMNHDQFLKTLQRLRELPDL